MNSNVIGKIIRLAQHSISENPNIRYGQALMIELHKVNKSAYLEAMLRGVDCFYDDEKVNGFLSFLGDFPDHDIVMKAGKTSET